LIPKIQTQHEIIAPERGAIDIFKGSVDLDLMVKEQGIDTIVHLANPRIYTSNQAMGETVVMLRNVLDVCQENNVKLVYPSSWEIYSGYRSHFLLASEVLPPVPKGPYGETKYLCEILLDQYRRRYGLDYVIVRSSPVYGAGDKPKFIHNFMQKAIHNEEITAHKYLNGFPSLDLLYIDDVISAIAAVLEGNHDGAFNIGGGKGISTTEVAHLLVKIAGTNSPIKHREINDFVSNIVMDTSRARTELDWYPRISIQDGLSRLFSDFCQESQ
jgi:UDP-glucuronate decarboxylase